MQKAGRRKLGEAAREEGKEVARGRDSDGERGGVERGSVETVNTGTLCAGKIYYTRPEFISRVGRLGERRGRVSGG
jgi:hypothetical protein